MYRFKIPENTKLWSMVKNVPKTCLRINIYPKTFWPKSFVGSIPGYLHVCIYEKFVEASRDSKFGLPMYLQMYANNSPKRSGKKICDPTTKEKVDRIQIFFQHWPETASGLPDGFFSEQNYQFGYILEDLGM
jgi:hypothetical protein